MSINTNNKISTYISIRVSTDINTKTNLINFKRGFYSWLTNKKESYQSN